MEKIKFEKVYFFLISLIPISIVAGPSISLINILFLSLLFLVNLKYINIKFENQKIIFLLIFLYFYLIFNSFISIDYKEGALRNFGFIRFIILFFAINYFYFAFTNKNKVFFIWSIVIFIVVIDSVIEFTFGQNLLGYGNELYKDRIVSFFKDEPIVGGYLLGFIFIIIGYLFDEFFKKSIKNKIFIFFIILLLVGCILITGERSNTIKAILALMIFLSLNKKINLKLKIYGFLLTLILSGTIVLNSNYLKVRYGEQLFLLLINDNQREKFFDGGNIYLRLYRSGIAVFKDHPFFGVGNKNYRVITTKNIETKINDDYLLNTHPHQVYIEFLSEHGLIGSIILLSIFFTLIFKNLKIIILSRNSVQLGCFTYLVINFIPILPSGSFFNDFSSTLFWINLSIMYACNEKTNIFTSVKNL